MNDPHLTHFSQLEPGQVRSSLRVLTGLPRRPRHASALRRLHSGMQVERGAATAEYAITTLAAVGFAGLLVVVLRSGEVRGMLTDIVRSALSIPS